MKLLALLTVMAVGTLPMIGCHADADVGERHHDHDRVVREEKTVVVPERRTETEITVHDR